jgi:hypothetical protein
MPRYYFVPTNRYGREVDPTGLVFPNDRVAEDAARAALRLIQAEVPGENWEGWAVEIFDSSMQLVARIQLGGIALGTSPVLRRKRGLWRVPSRDARGASVGVRRAPLSRSVTGEKPRRRAASSVVAAMMLVCTIVFLTDERPMWLWEDPRLPAPHDARQLPDEPTRQQRPAAAAAAEVQVHGSEQRGERRDPSGSPLFGLAVHTTILGHGIQRLEMFAAVALPRTPDAVSTGGARTVSKKPSIVASPAGRSRPRRVREPVQFMLAARG